MDHDMDRTTEVTLLWTAAQPSVTPQLADAEDILQVASMNS
jgi:hypothetical protein